MEDSPKLTPNQDPPIPFHSYVMQMRDVVDHHSLQHSLLGTPRVTAVQVRGCLGVVFILILRVCIFNAKN